MIKDKHMLEQDRYKQNPKLYIFGMVMLMCFWIFTLLSLYILPFLIWGLHYNVPEAIIGWQYHLETNYSMSIQLSKLLTFLTFAIPALICFFISWLISAHIDKKIVLSAEEIERTSVPVDMAHEKQSRTPRPTGEELSFASMIILIILMVLLLLFGIQWLISEPIEPTQPTILTSKTPPTPAG